MSEEAGGRAGEAADTELKTKTPHVNVGNKRSNHRIICSCSIVLFKILK